MFRTITTHTDAETARVGRELATVLEPGAIVLLRGDLGAGKTTFVRGLAEGLGIDPGEVSSPTFTLIQEYGGGRLPLQHVDLYRVGDRDEVEDLGLEEILSSGGITAIEWAERLPWPLDEAVVVSIDHGEASMRVIRIHEPTRRA